MLNLPLRMSHLARRAGISVAVTLALAACHDVALQNYNQGIDAMERGDTATALANFKSAVDARPSDPDARVNYGVALLETGHPGDALVQFEAASATNPNDPDIHVNLAEAYKATGKLADARTEYERALRISPDKVQALSGYGELLMRQGDYDEAASRLRHAIRVAPDDAAAQLHMGWLYLRTGRADESTQYFLHGLQLEPRSAYGHRGLGEAYLARKLPADALTEFQKVYSADSNDVNAMIGIGRCQIELGNHAAAESVLRRAVAHAPRNADARSWLGAALGARREYEESVSQYRMAIQLDAENAAAYLGLGSVLEQAGHLNEAEAALTAGLAHAPLDPRLRYRLGMVYIDMNDMERARISLETALDQARDDAALRTTIQSALDSIK
ncbi:MAG TPA: tetratricopeptide repeat protein [Candidatus Krumholzibacteria bacterium]|nr:tetratricopeptide repeat protein [Candidatus Krumholzibacteria bacterium]